MDIDMNTRFVPYYRLNKHLIWPLEKNNKYSATFIDWLDTKINYDDIIFDLMSEFLGQYKDKTDYPVFNTIHLYGNTGSPVPIVRARCFPTTEEVQARRALRSPRKGLGPPPPELTADGRCNFANKPVFYGSYQDYTCVSEVSPEVSSLIVLASFIPARPLKIFRFCSVGDLIDFRMSEYQTSIAKFRRVGLYDHVSFQYHINLWLGFPLKNFSYDHKEYVARRKVVESIRQILFVDGIEFESSQVEGSNLVIFPENEEHTKFPLRYLNNSAEMLRITERPIYAEDFRRSSSISRSAKKTKIFKFPDWQHVS